CLPYWRTERGHCKVPVRARFVRASDCAAFRRSLDASSSHRYTVGFDGNGIFYLRSFARMLKFYTAGESHGQALLAFISGLPASMPVDLNFINHELHRRQLGYGRGGRQKIEKDRAEIFAGVRHGETIGAPI